MAAAYARLKNLDNMVAPTPMGESFSFVDKSLFRLFGFLIAGYRVRWFGGTRGDVAVAVAWGSVAPAGSAGYGVLDPAGEGEGEENTGP